MERSLCLPRGIKGAIECDVTSDASTRSSFLPSVALSSFLAAVASALCVEGGSGSDGYPAAAMGLNRVPVLPHFSPCSRVKKLYILLNGRSMPEALNRLRTFRSSLKLHTGFRGQGSEFKAYGLGFRV